MINNWTTFNESLSDDLIQIYKDIERANISDSTIIERISAYHKFINYDQYEYGTFLVTCSYSNRYEVSKYLLENGADANISHEMISPLNYAASNGYLDIVKILLEYGAFIDAVDENNETSLISATINNGSNVIFYLLEKGASWTRDNADNYFIDYLNEKNSQEKYIIEEIKKLYPTEYKKYLKIKSSKKFNI